MIPAHNAQPFLGPTIASVSAQSWADWRLVVVDDGSEDATYDTAMEQARGDERITVHRQENRGVAGARNRGATLAGADARFLLFLDHDDRLEPDALATLHAALAASEQAVAAYGLARDVDLDGRPLHRALAEAHGYHRVALSATGPPRSMAPDEPDSFANLVGWPSISTPSQVLIRADALARAGPFDPATVPSDDWDLWIRLSLLGPLRRELRFTVDKRKDHSTSYHRNPAALRSAEPSLRRKLATGSLLNRQQKEIARLGQRYACGLRLHWARDLLRRGDWPGAVRAAAQGARSYTTYLRTPW